MQICLSIVIATWSLIGAETANEPGRVDKCARACNEAKDCCPAYSRFCEPLFPNSTESDKKACFYCSNTDCRKYPEKSCCAQVGRDKSDPENKRRITCGTNSANERVCLPRCASSDVKKVIPRY